MMGPAVLRRETELSTEGLLLVDKPAGMTSHDVVSLARRALAVRRIGHHGTLDPFATGLLVLLVGRATRLAPFIAGEPKVYDAVVRFGSETDTDDLTGTVIREAPLPTPESVRAALPALTGRLEQLPPAVSAKLVGGERAYAAVRAGRKLELRPATVFVHEWVVHELTPERLSATIRCGGGTYIRALARDLGRAVGSAAHLASLRRTASGPFAVEEAVAAGALRTGEDLRLRPALDGLPGMPRELLDDGGAAAVSHGRAVPASVPGTFGALLDRRGGLLAVAERVGELWQPRVVLDAG